MSFFYLELIEDPVNEERERRRKAVEKWTKESNDKFANGYKNLTATLCPVYGDSVMPIYSGFVFISVTLFCVCRLAKHGKRFRKLADYLPDIVCIPLYFFIYSPLTRRSVCV